MRTQKRYMRGLAVTVALCVAAALPVYASSPEFARTPEEWEHLRDNKLEYHEIDDLVSEYNPTVNGNNYELNRFRQEYGTTNTQVADSYRQLADELMNSIDYSDHSSSNPLYAASAMTAVVNESTAKQLNSLADSALEDYEIKRLGYEMAEKGIAQAARANMIGYYSGQLSAEAAGLNAELAGLKYSVTSVHSGIGMATQTELLTAREALLNAQKDVTSAESAVRESLKKLQVACGWKYESVPEIGMLPEPDTAGIALIDPAADIKKALENNYTLRINERKLSNSQSESTKQTLAAAVEGNRQNIAVSVNSAYLSLKAAVDALNYASSAASLSAANLELSRRGYAEGTVSSVDLRTAEISARLAVIAAEQAKLSLLQSAMNYDYVVGGLASA